MSHREGNPTVIALAITTAVLAIALALVLLSPHVGFLKPIAQRLGLVQTQAIYVPVNHTVYVYQTVVKYINQTILVPVPIYINRTVLIYTYTCNGSIPYTTYNTTRIIVYYNNTITNNTTIDPINNTTTTTTPQPNNTTTINNNQPPSHNHGHKHKHKHPHEHGHKHE